MTITYYFAQEPAASFRMSLPSSVLPITGRSLYEKTPVIKNIEKALGSAHGGTFSKIGQHAYVRCSLISAVETDMS